MMLKLGNTQIFLMNLFQENEQVTNKIKKVSIYPFANRKSSINNNNGYF